MLKEYIQNGIINKERLDKVKYLINETKNDDRLFQYYLFLAKKYLWNNYQPKLSRKNLTKAIHYKLKPSVLIFLFVSLLPESVIRNLYKKLRIN